MNYLKTLFCIFTLFFVSLAYAGPPEFVYKASIYMPERVFQEGFHSAGDDENFIQHISGRLCIDDEDGFISTIANWSFVDQLVRNTLTDEYYEFPSSTTLYVYSIRATNNFYSSHTTLDHLVNLEHSPIESMSDLQLSRALLQRSTEYITPVEIEPQLIKEVDIYTINSHGVITVRHQDNDNYAWDETYANAGPYLGSDSLPPQNLSMPLVAGTPPATACLLPNEDSSENFSPFLLYMLNNFLDE